MKKVNLYIPATSANLGLGFDSMGLALDLFLSIEACEAEAWQFEFGSQELDVLPKDATNLVAATAIQVAEAYGQEMPALQVEMWSEIPLTHGLGSSSSAIVAGIELANQFCSLDLSSYDKIRLGSEIEGHPDNIGPCITGGIFVGYYGEGDLFYHSFPIHDLGIILSIPSYELSTKLAREVLPESYPRALAVKQNALNNIMVLALHQQDYQTMGKLMMQDAYHEPYRSPLIKEFAKVKETALAAGAYATVISGAGPTILTLCAPDRREQILAALRAEVDCQHKVVNLFHPLA